mmetsp:Transcript_33512/g.56085  ORF Transcript_33512/g.56085 Transcript_33512/m.56085 type:complete len:332 (-) Transcript_33512:122-1117(-)
MLSMTVRGTPYFMAPEVFEEKYSAKADIWGIGCVAFQMATGIAPWKDKGFTNPISLFNYIKSHNGPPRMVHPDLDSFSHRQQTAWNLFEELVSKCFDHVPNQRPTVSELQADPFFLTVHDVEDDVQEFRGLFSPQSEGKVSNESQFFTSPTKNESPMRSPQPVSPSQKMQRSKSVVQWKTSFLTPPRPKKNSEVASPSPFKGTPKRNSKSTPKRSPQTTPRRTPNKTPKPTAQRPEGRSPSPDTREWPDWARIELKRQLKTCPSPGDKEAPLKDASPMGSLALSEDSIEPTPKKQAGKDRFSTIGSTTTANSSNLIGLEFLEGTSNSTYEI